MNIRKIFMILSLVSVGLLLIGCSFSFNSESKEVETEDIDEVDVVDEAEEEVVTDVGVEMDAIETEEEETEEEETEVAQEVMDGIVAAFVAKYPEWDLDVVQFTFDDVRDSYASGGVTFIDRSTGEVGSGGYWFAAMSDGGWVIAADGNGVIWCEEIEPYDFPVDMIAECADENGNPVARQ